jgi:hypothetical protein
MRKAAYLREVGVCEACYRFGPRNKCTPRVSADPERYARLYAIWRRAHRRFARRYAEAGNGRTINVGQAERLAGRILHAMSGIGTKPNEEGMAA